LEGVLKSNEEKLKQLKISKDDEMKHKEELEQQRKKALEDYGLSTDEIMANLKISKDSAHLINITSDASMENFLLYYLKEGKTSLGCAVVKNDIVVKGLAVKDFHCTITNEGNKKVFVIPKKPEKQNRVLVNGNVILGKTELHHLDRLVVGHGNAFKVMIPTQGGSVPKSAEVMDYNQIMKDRLNSNETEAKNLRRFLEETRDRLGEKKSEKFAREL
jgi:hypothetical protein